MKLMLTAFLSLILINQIFAQYEIGEIVDNFSLKNIDGKMVALSDYNKGQGVILIFDCNTCPYSKMYNERIIALNKQYKAKGFPVITVNVNDPVQSPGDSYEEMVKVAKSKNYDFPYLQDETQIVGKAFGATNTPHVFVLKKSEKGFKVAYIGAIDNNTRDEKAATRKYVEEAVNAIIDNKAVPTEKTRAIGCGIKYRNS
jgi:glutathione peroxidase-family protein